MPHSDRAPGLTFASADIGWIDWETKTSTVDITAGIYAYALDADAIIAAYAIGDAPVRVIATPRFPHSLTTADFPQDFQHFIGRVQRGEAVWAAWNSSFDKTIWNVCTDLPWLEPHHVIDPMVQATVSGLAPDLTQASKQCGGAYKKNERGKLLIKLFSETEAFYVDNAQRKRRRLEAGKGWSDEDEVKAPTVRGTPDSHPVEWQEFCSYAGDDIAAMRSVFKHTRQLSLAEWKEFWAAERINERGVGIDVPMVAQAARLAEEDKQRSRVEIKQLTDGAVETVDQVKRITGWLLERLPPAGCQILIQRKEEKDDDGVLVRPAKHQLTRKQVQRLIALCLTDPKLATELRLLQIRLYGGSKAPAKYPRILQQQVDGVLMGSYSFNGAPGTGRFCVAADTLVDTPRGERKIVDLSNGDVVYGGSGKPRVVLAKIYKGREAMYRLDGPNGEHVVATAAHRILTCNGWARLDECFEETTGRRFVLRRGCTPVSYDGLQHRDDSFDAQSDTSHGCRRREKEYDAGGISTTEIGELFTQQDRREQSDDGCALRRRTHPATGSSVGLEWRGLHAREPYYGGEIVGAIGTADTLGGASHRRRQDQRRPGQLRDRDQGWTPEAAQADAWTLVPVGEGDVWDISVEGDASYLAQGLIHHNSSKGPQIHNLTRDALDEEPDLINALLHACDYTHFAKLGSDTPVARKLALLVRPALVPEKDRVFCISDWSQIEARVLPWLAGDDPGALERLQIFREVDLDPSLPDLYTRTAAGLAGIPIADVTKPIRQIGKIAELALGFLGGVGALQGMAANYNIFITDPEAKVIVDSWRAINSWAMDFGDALWDAAISAMEWPGVPQSAGRITYIYLPKYLGGSLLCVLPSGRAITYRDIRFEKLPDLDDDDQPTGRYSTHLRCARGYGRVKIWKGIFAENVTQGTAADFLRGTLVRLEDQNLRTRLHTHDEVGVETELKDVHHTEACVRDIMRAGFDWSEGLPLMSEETLMYYYTKNEGSHGL